uniref:Aminoacyl-transfer RNA synthetases class-II family profile domain-containing protein n=1 Tax=Fibrocapsa japonica TaxID=94617 RepID=A0A7S2UXM3_9STRA
MAKVVNNKVDEITQPQKKIKVSAPAAGVHVDFDNDLRARERAIWMIKGTFQGHIEEQLNLERASAPLIIKSGQGVNDDLNGIEKKATFKIKNMGNMPCEIPQSLAKWKRIALKKYGMQPGEGIWVNMNAIRPDEDVDAWHSIYVDQYDWERVLSASDRNVEFLKGIVRKIYAALKATESAVHEAYPQIEKLLPEEITFIHTTELEEKYPDLTPKERERAASKEYGACFVIGIGAPLKNGVPHDGRAPDYDDWSTPTPLGPGLNGDILVWNPILQREFELSSMGIRVNKDSLQAQLAQRNCLERAQLLYHQGVLNDEWPLTIGGGIGQARLCMYFLRRSHVGETQSSVWAPTILDELKTKGVKLL